MLLQAALDKPPLLMLDHWQAMRRSTLVSA
jgi:hypothetical protein